MPYEVVMENDDTALLRCWGTMTSQHAHDFLAKIYYSQEFMHVKFFIRDYLEVTEVLVDEDLPAYAALFEAAALKNLNKHLILAIVAQGIILPALKQYIQMMHERDPLSVIKLFTNIKDARGWMDSQ
ncbi:hypothetical protein JYT13_00270 [Mariprofundus ferrooxydans]|nr:hypothetical protein [Mariprofundus ferrooxydans]